MQTGKLPLDLLGKLLSKIEVTDPRVILGGTPGEDAALIDIGDRYLISKTDPITFVTDLIGWYLVQVNANDIAVMGGTPRWLMATLLLPEHTNEETVENIFAQLREACTKLGVTLVGGHTEVTKNVYRPIAVGAMLGEVEKERAVFTSTAEPGDRIVLTKGIAVEGTSILAREASTKLEDSGISNTTIQRAQAMLFTPGISVVEEARIACEVVDVHAMHDPTEGGISGGLVEIARGANVGFVIQEETIPILPECKEFCEVLGLDPLGLIASGALLATMPASSVSTFIHATAQQGIKAYEIGKVTSPDQGMKLNGPEGLRDFPTFERDELARWFDE